MRISTRQTAALSFTAQICTKALNLILSILMVRLAPSSSVGTFTLLIAAAQLVCSLGRMGTNYSYAVLFPQQNSEPERLHLTASYSLFGLATSLLISVAALWQLAHAPGMSEVFHEQVWGFSALTLIYLLSDSFSETIWSIHLALGQFKAVFLRDVWLAFGKGVLPLAGALWIGPMGVAAGLGLISIFNCWIATSLLQQRMPTGILLARKNRGISWKLLKQLLIKGLPFFSVPLVSNLILWPMLMHVVNTSGIDKLDGLRVAQICAQVIGIISASLMPVLLVKSSHDNSSSQAMHQRAFQACWCISLIIYSLYALSDTTLIPLLFGTRAGDTVIQIARMLVAAAAIQGLSQIPLQRPFPTSRLLQLSILQIGSLGLAAFAAVQIIQPLGGGLLAYASINLLSPLVTVLLLPLVLGVPLISNGKSSWLQIFMSLSLATTCFVRQTGLVGNGLLIVGIGLIIFENRWMLNELQPSR